MSSTERGFQLPSFDENGCVVRGGARWRRHAHRVPLKSCVVGIMRGASSSLWAMRAARLLARAARVLRECLVRGEGSELGLSSDVGLCALGAHARSALACSCVESASFGERGCVASEVEGLCRPRLCIRRTCAQRACLLVCRESASFEERGCVASEVGQWFVGGVMRSARLAQREFPLETSTLFRGFSVLSSDPR